MTSLAIVRWRRDQKLPLIVPVFIFWPIMLTLLITGFTMQLGPARWVQLGKKVVLVTRIVSAMRGTRVSLRDDDSFLDIVVL